MIFQKLTDDEEIAFKACTHSALIKMAYKDFARLAEPIVIRFAMP